MQLDLRRTAAFVAGLAMVAGIAYFLVSDSGAEQPPPPSQGNGSAESPRPTETPSPTTEPPPELNNTGNDFEAIWRSINEYRNWLYMNEPSRKNLARIYEKQCKCFRAEMNVVRKLAARNWLYDDQGVDVLSVKVIEQPSRHLVGLEVADELRSQRVVNSEGETMKQGPGWDPLRRLVSLHRGGDGRWRVDLARTLGPYEVEG
jgi:hypothetical protein